MRNLLFEGFRRLPHLRIHQPGPYLVIKPLQVLRDLPALVLVKRGLQMPEHKNRVIDLASPIFNVAPPMRPEGPA